MCYMDADSFIVYIETEETEEIKDDALTGFDTLNYELDRPLPKGKKIKSNWIKERLIRWKNYDKICWIKSKSL